MARIARGRGSILESSFRGGWLGWWIGRGGCRRGGGGGCPCFGGGWS